MHPLLQTCGPNREMEDIKPSPDETNKTEELHGISWTKPRHPTSNGSRTRHHAWIMASGTLTRAAEGSWLSQLGSQPHAPLRRPCHPPIYLAWESSDHTNSYAPTHAARVSFSSPRAGNAVMRLPCAEELLLMSSDVTAPRQHATHALVHVI